MITALTAGGLSFGSFSQVSTDSMLERATQEYQKKLDALNESFGQTSATIDKETDRYITLSSNIKNAELAIDNGLEGIEKIESLILDMRAALGDLQSTGSDYYREAYDEALRKINNQADMYSASFNPIGRVADRETWEANDITYNPDFGPTEITLNGTYVGADFRIEDENGTTWIPDLGSQSLSEYVSYNTEKPEDSSDTGRDTSLLTGITNVTDPDVDGKQTFTMIIDGVETDITGTLVTGGLGLTGTWNHNGLATNADISAALKDLDRADAILAGAKAQMTSNMTMVESSQARVDEKMDALTQKKKDALYDNLEAQMELQEELSSQALAMERNIALMSEQQKNYLSVFSSTMASFGKNNPFFYDQTV